MSRVDRWFVLSVHTPSRDLYGLVAEGLVALGANGVLEEDGALVAFFPQPADADAFLADAREQLLSGLPFGTSIRLDARWQPNEDWAATWKRGLQPRRITNRLVVKPTWTRWSANEGEVIIDLDPQMAFGTGEHATTRGCLRLLDRSIRPDDRVLDIGSGSGILAIAAAKLGASEVLAIEYDPDANLNARENLDLNGVPDRVRIIEALADPVLLEELRPFDLILANILSGVIRPLLPTLRAALNSGGRLIVSGILHSEHADVVRDAHQAGLAVDLVDEEEDWWSAMLVPRAFSSSPNGGD